MVQKLTAFFDGSHFVPIGAVDVDAGTDVELTVTPIRQVVPVPYRRILTDAEERAWSTLTARLKSTPLEPPDVDDYLRDMRGRPE